MSFPFDYPAVPHARRHGPRGYADYASFRPWLRDDFDFRCVFCLLREAWGRQSSFAIDHFLPVVYHPGKVGDYDNLLYTCNVCNAAKGAQLLPDPSQVLTNVAVHVREDGTIHADDPQAAALIELLGLDSEEFCEFRLLWIGIISLAARHDPELYGKLMGYPDDLPALRRLRPPGGNTRPEGIEMSYFAQRKRGVLPATY